MSELISQASFMAHGYCLLWQPWLVALFAGSDFLIFLAYSAIPIALFRFLKMRPDIQERRLVALFGAFILLCGLTHLLSLITLWFPAYPVLGVVKAITAIVSILTAIMVFPLVPKLARLPHPQELQDVNARLRVEIKAHEDTLVELRAAQRGLENKVALRTEDLNRSNQQMRILMNEMAHRSRNLLTVVQSIARQSARFAQNIPDFITVLSDRLQVLADATNQMVEGWDNRSSDLNAVLKRQIAPVELSFPGRITIEGPQIDIPVESAGQIALAVHELSTNALKYGAFADESGHVGVRWDHTPEGGLILVWSEHSGTGATVGEGEPVEGFGQILLTRAVPISLNAAVRYEPITDGLIYQLTLPPEALVIKEPTIPEISDQLLTA